MDRNNNNAQIIMKRTSRESRRRQSLERENDELKNMVEILQERLKMTTRSGVGTTSLLSDESNGSDVEASSAFYLPTKDDDRRMQKHGGQEQQRRHHRNHSHSPRENARVGTPRKSMQGHDAVRPDFFKIQTRNFLKDGKACTTSSKKASTPGG